jgi:hypothetical protein
MPRSSLWQRLRGEQVAMVPTVLPTVGSSEVRA